MRALAKWSSAPPASEAHELADTFERAVGILACSELEPAVVYSPATRRFWSANGEWGPLEAAELLILTDDECHSLDEAMRSWTQARIVALHHARLLDVFQCA
jgi:hypothetical protein